MIELTGNVNELRDLVKGFKGSEHALEKAGVSAINKTIVSTQSFTAKKISDEYRITQKDVKKELKLIRATMGLRQAELKAKGIPGIPLSKFSVTPSRVPSTIHKPGRRVKVKGKRGRVLKREQVVKGSDKYLPGEGIKVMVRRGSRKLIRNAFVVELDSGHVGVFARDTARSRPKKKNLPIEELFGPSVVRILDSERYTKPIDEEAAKLLDKNMQHEAEFYLKREGIL